MPTTTKNEALTHKFSKPFQFEGKSFESVDLSGIEDITAAQLASIEEGVSAVSPMPEMTLDYALLLAAKVTEHPLAFFQSLPGKEALKIKRLVQGFLFN